MEAARQPAKGARPPAMLAVESDDDAQPIMKRQVSADSKDGQDLNCRLVGCSCPSPTAIDVLDAPRLEFDVFRRQASALAEEFFCSLDVKGMVDSIDSLDSACFHDELVVILLRASLDRKDQHRQAVVKLLNVLADENKVSTPQLVRGFEKMVLTWSDLRLDVPDAPGHLVALLSEKVGLLDKAFFSRLPEELLQTLVGELGPDKEPFAVGSAARVALETHLGQLSSFKSELATHLDADLFRDRSVETFGKWLRSQDKPAFHHEVVLRACLRSFQTDPSLNTYWASCFDARGLADEQRRLVLELLDFLRSPVDNAVLEDVDLQIGFSRLLGEVGQQQLENPSRDVRDRFVALLRGAVEHELLAAEFLKTARRMRFGNLFGVDVIKEAQRQTPLYSRRSWGSGDVRQFRAEIQLAIAEYFDSRSVEELGQIIEELHLAEKEQAQFVRKLLVFGMEREQSTAALDAVSELVGRCWSVNEVRQAFEELRQTMADLALDFPHCRERTTDLVTAATGRGLLEKSYQIEAIV